MNRLSAVVAIVAVALSAGCAPRLSEPQIQAISQDAPALIARHRPPSIIEPSDWPASITALNPEGVLLSVDGLYIITASIFVSQWGVFVPCSPKNFAPPSGGDPSYTRIADGVYSFYDAG